MTWWCRSVLVSTHFWLLTDHAKNQNSPKPMIGPTKYCAKHSYKLTLYRTYSCAHFYFGNDMFARKSNDVESRYLPEKVTLLQVESSM